MKKRLQILFSTLLLISISWQCGAKSFIYFNFKWRQNELAQTVCEKKGVPGSCCKAKCYLDKEIKKEEKREADFPSSLKEKSAKSELFSEPLQFGALPALLISIAETPHVFSIPETRPHLVFHPPAR